MEAKEMKNGRRENEDEGDLQGVGCLMESGRGRIKEAKKKGRNSQDEQESSDKRWEERK